MERRRLDDFYVTTEDLELIDEQEFRNKSKSIYCKQVQNRTDMDNVSYETWLKQNRNENPADELRAFMEKMLYKIQNEIYKFERLYDFFEHMEELQYVVERLRWDYNIPLKDIAEYANDIVGKK